MLDTAIILAGGLGTRLRSVLPDTPKCLAPINNKPFLAELIKFLKKQGINKFIFSLGYKSELIIKYLGDEFIDTNIDYSIEDEQLGTGGAIKLALSKVLSDDVLVINGDTFFKNDLYLFYRFHKNNNSKFSISVTKVENNYRFGSVVLNDENIVINFSEKSKNESVLINAGHYIINREHFLKFKTEDKFSIELDFFQNCSINKVIYGFEFLSDFIDIGIPEDLIKAQSFFNKN